jgi:hypothetical protein
VCMTAGQKQRFGDPRAVFILPQPAISSHSLPRNGSVPHNRISVLRQKRSLKDKNRPPLEQKGTGNPHRR